jgi:hypothetical protein
LIAIAFAFRRKILKDRIWASVLFLGAIGFVISLVFSAIAVVRNDDSAFKAGILWPTSFVLMAGQINDPLWAKLLVFGMATLSNIGVYGFVGLIVGTVWNWIRLRASRSQNVNT